MEQDGESSFVMIIENYMIDSSLEDLHVGSIDKWNGTASHFVSQCPTDPYSIFN